jgi:hypothetical protein
MSFREKTWVNRQASSGSNLQCRQTDRLLGKPDPRGAVPGVPSPTGLAPAGSQPSLATPGRLHGVLGGVRLEALIADGQLAIRVSGGGAGRQFDRTVNPVPVTLTIREDCGTTSVEALIIH